MEIPDSVIARWNFFINLLKHSTDQAAQAFGELLSKANTPENIAKLTSLISQFYAKGGLANPNDEEIIAILKQISELTDMSTDDIYNILKSLDLTPEQIDELIDEMQKANNNSEKKR